MQYHIEFDTDLRRNPYKGLYIAFEGIDGAGKTTQVERLTAYFEKEGRRVVATREPRKKGLIGDIIQEVLQGKRQVSSIALQYLFSTDRILQHEEVIIPALKAGKVVITDRCFWSAVVYGILDRTGGNYDYKMANLVLIAQSILSMYNQFIVPDYTFYLKISLPTALVRISEKGGQKEIYEEKKKLVEATEGYDWLLGKFSKEITVVNGQKSVVEVTSEILRKLPKSPK